MGLLDAGRCGLPHPCPYGGRLRGGFPSELPLALHSKAAGGSRRGTAGPSLPVLHSVSRRDCGASRPVPGRSACQQVRLPVLGVARRVAAVPIASREGGDATKSRGGLVIGRSMSRFKNLLARNLTALPTSCSNIFMIPFGMVHCFFFRSSLTPMQTVHLCSVD